MEIEDLKKMWNKQNQELEKIMSLNEKLLKNTFSQRTHGVIESMLKWDYFSLIEFIIFFIFMAIATFKFMDDWRFLLSGIFILFFLASCIIGSLISIKRLNSIHLFSQSLVDIKNRMLTYKKLSNQFIKILLFLIPPVIVTFIPLGAKFIRNITLYDYPVFFITLSTGIIILSYIIAIISQQLLFTRKYRIIENNLAELEKFVKE